MRLPAAPLFVARLPAKGGPAERFPGEARAHRA